MVGICRNSYISGGAGRIVYRAGGHYITATPSEPSDPASFAVGDIIGVALDLDDAAGKIRFYKNGTLQPVLANGDLDDVKSDLSISTLGGVFPYVQMYHNDVCTINFGQTPFIHTPPTGFRALSVKNLTTTTGSSIADPREHFDTLIWDGTNNASRDITGLQFKPDLVWIKNRVQANTHSWQDSMIGFGDDKTLRVDTSNALDTNGNLYGYINHTLHNGINVNSGTDHGSSRVNSSASGAKHVAWCWKAGGAAVTNNEGTASGSVSANPEAGFSIVSYTGSGGHVTRGHGLGKKPELIIMKKTGETGHWFINLDDSVIPDAGYDRNYVRLNTTGGVEGPNGNIAPSTEPGGGAPVTDTIYSLGGDMNESGKPYINYLWASIPGYSKVGAFRGNGAAPNGSYVHTGFKVGWLLLRKVSGTADGYVLDQKRSPTVSYTHLTLPTKRIV